MKIKHLIVGVLMAVVTVMVTTLPALAVDPPDSTPTVISKKFYRNLLESGDRLVVVYFNIPYATPPSDPASDVFIWELIDTDDTTKLGMTTGYGYVNDGYGYQVISMYFDADAALTWGAAYTLRLRGNPIKFTSPPVYNYPFAAGEYTALSEKAAVQSELAADILTIAEGLDTHWGLSVSLISEEETGQVLSTFGQAYFRGAIYSIQALAPPLFPLAIRNIDIEQREWTDSYINTLANQYQGTWIETAKAAGGALFGMDYDLLSLMVLLALVVGVIIGNVMVTNSQWNGLMDAAFVLVVSTRIGLFGLGYLLLLAAICLIYMAIRIWSAIRG